MDIQKEKIAHEKHLLSQGVDFKYLPNIKYSELENVYELIEWDEEYSEALNEINSSWCTWQAAKAVPEGFVLVSAEQMSQWGHMASYAEQYGCPECFEARGYAHSLACEINEFFAIEAQEPAND